MRKSLEHWVGWSLDCALIIAALALAILVSALRSAFAAERTPTTLPHLTPGRAIETAIAIKAGQVAEGRRTNMLRPQPADPQAYGNSRSIEHLA